MICKNALGAETGVPNRHESDRHFLPHDLRRSFRLPAFSPLAEAVTAWRPTRTRPRGPPGLSLRFAHIFGGGLAECRAHRAVKQFMVFWNLVFFVLGDQAIES